MSGDFGDTDDLKPTEDWGQIIVNAIGYSFDGHATNPSLAAEFCDGLTFHIHSNGLTACGHFPSSFRGQNWLGDSD